MADPRSIRVVQAAVTVRLRVATELTRAHLGEPAETLGPRLAAQVDRLVRERRLGYYPPLEFFAGDGGIDPQLLAELECFGAFVQTYVLKEIPRRLQAVFSNVRVGHAQLMALTMPGMRPSQSDAVAALARHYTPDTMKLELVLSTVTRGTVEGMERLVTQKLHWWLRDGFASVEVTDARMLEA